MSPLQFARQSMEDIARCKSFLDDGNYPEFTVSHWELRNAFDAVVKETRCPPSAVARQASFQFESAVESAEV